MRRLSILAVIGSIFVSALSTSTRAAEIGFVEDFALGDRQEALQQLIPGTEEYYYYHCLHYQNTGELAKIEDTLKAWIKRHNETALVQQIQNRQALLTYDQAPDRSLDFIRRRLELHLNHQRQRLDRKPAFPTALNADQISRETLTRRALGRHDNLNGFENSALDWLIDTDLNAERRRHLIQRLSRPDHSDLPRLVVEDLRHPHSRGFGSMPIHGLMLLSQLDACARLEARLLANVAFVQTYLTKLRPGPDDDWHHDARQRQAYLDRLWSFVEGLPPVHNSLKAHVLYHRLEFDRSQGVYSQDRFMNYVKLPRRATYVNPTFLRLDQNRRHAVDLRADFEAQTLLPPIHDDEPLVRSYLAHYFVDVGNYEVYETYIRETYLKQVFAETKILNGIGDMEQWYSMLTPAAYQGLKDRVDLDFAFTNKTVFGADDPVALDVLVKNVQKLIVKVYRINNRNYYLANGRHVNTDINLDGLVANEELSFNYGEPPLRRVRRHFAFGGLDARGTYVIDFIGNGKSSRALIRKGRLRFVVHTSGAGHLFSVMDERNRPLPEATIHVGGHHYEPDEIGVITVPFTNQPGRQPVILVDGDFASLDAFQHEAENYTLEAGFHVDREALLSRRTAQVAVRVSLKVNGVPAPLGLLENTRLSITSVDLDSVSTTQRVEAFELREEAESVHEFQVPDRLQSIAFRLDAQIKQLSQNKTIDLAAADQFAINGIDQSDHTQDLHLLRDGDRYVLDVLGKSGESRPDQPVHLVLKHRDFTEPVTVVLKTDAAGSIDLGTLVGIVSIKASGQQLAEHTWQLGEDDYTYPSIVHGQVGEPVRVPYLGERAAPHRSELSLLTSSDGTFVTDRFDALSIQDSFIVIENLPPGDYDLMLKDAGRRIAIRLTDGEQREGYVLSAKRHLELHNPEPMHVVAVEEQADAIRIRLRNATDLTRVHVVATRYVPAFSLYENLARVRHPQPLLRAMPDAESIYMAGRNIGDEYRYILDRKYVTKFPGNLLTRPGLLLNPWAIRKTQADRQQAAKGGAMLPGTPPAEAAAKRAEEAATRPAGKTDHANLDFLARSCVVLANLAPDQSGFITIDRQALGDRQHLHVVAVDPYSTVYRQLVLADNGARFLDLRLADGLEPAEHFTEQKQVSTVDKGEDFVLEDVKTSQLEPYDTLATVYRLYSTLSSDDHLREFRFILEWPALEPDQKREKYSKYACHELSFFLHKKDPQFFREVVLPYLANKKDKTFLDNWLLGNELSGFRDPWSYARLNVVERALLAQRIAEERAGAARHINDLFDLMPPDIERFNFLFRTALKGSALEAGAGVGGMLGEDEEMDGESFLADAVDAPAAPATVTMSTNGRVVEGEELAEAKAPGVYLAGANVVAMGSRMSRSDKKQDLARTRERRKSTRQLYRKLDKTEEWAENNYYKLPIQAQDADLVTVSAFWRDYANHGGDGPFLSAHLAEASSNFTEMMFALSVLDLPFEAGEHETNLDGARYTLSADSPVVLFHKQIRPARADDDQTPLLVSQNFFRHGDRYRHVHNERLDKFVTDEFLVQTVYGCQVVITNPTSAHQKLDVLLQVPRGAIPVLRGQATRGLHLDLEPYHTQTVEYYFYFPKSGRFEHYPVHVARNGWIIAFAEPFVFNAVDELSQIDRESWDYVSQHGTADQVLEFLTQNNLERINLDLIAWRMRDEAFFQNVLELLQRRHVYNDTLWSYCLKHNHLGALRQFLKHADGFVNACGSYIDATPLTIDPVERRSYEHLQYSPLVNPRAHSLGKRRHILNDRFGEQYHRLLDILARRPALDDVDRMAVTYYLLLQDRVEEAIAFFGNIDPQKLPTRLQHDYFAAYLDFFRDEPRLARAIASRYEDHPVDRWRKLFANVRAQLDEIEGRDGGVADDLDRTQKQSRLASTAPGFEVQIDGATVRLDYQNLSNVRVDYYLMDIELLFSSQPFVQQYSNQFSFIRPNQTQQIDLDPNQATFEFGLPQRLRNTNVMVQITGGGVTKAKPYFSNALSVQVVENYGQLRVTGRDTGAAHPKVYVKVYARSQNGQVEFYKDGYTDLRGRFDYTSLNTDELDRVAKFSILILSEEHGAVVREANPPKR